MPYAIKVNDDIKLIPLNSKKRQLFLMYHLLTKNKERLAPYFPGIYQKPLSIDEVKKLLIQKEKAAQNHEITSFAICSRRAKQIIGEIDIYHTLIDANLTYWIDKDFEGKGIISRSFDVLREHLFTQNITAISASCDRTNDRSISFLENKGLKIVASYNNHYNHHFVDLMQTKIEYLFYKRLNSSQLERG